MFIELFILLIVLISVYEILFYIQNRPFFLLAKQLNGPISLPILGNAHLFRGTTQDILTMIKYLMHKYQSPMKLWFAYRYYTVVFEPQHVEIVLNKALEKDKTYELTIPWTGTGLFAAPVSKWRVHRKIIQPTFNMKMIESFMDVFVIQSEILVKILEKQLTKNSFDVFKYMSPCTLDIICETAMGYKISAQLGGNTEYVHRAMRQLKIEFERITKVWLQKDFIFNLTAVGREQKENVKFLHSITDNVIKKKMGEYMQRRQKTYQEENHEDNDDGLFSRRKAFLDYLIELGDSGFKFSETNLREEVDTMMIAGNDTTASVNSFVLMVLGMYQDIQEKVYEEIYDIFGESDRPCTNEDVKRMTYLEMVIKETMRIFPPGAVIMRSITTDLKLTDTITLPKNSGAIIGIIAIHHSPKIYPNPYKFDPNRFLPEEIAKRHPYSFLPFSGGPRNCIGLKYAYQSMKCVLSTILRSYRIYSNENIETIPLKLEIFMKPVNGYQIRIEKRRKL
ncbi:cytochrome P450 4C1-like [Chrysoperla carnea]|uniref:cytochrome P450 4C1-like n=1 Tax=Chrysoperla carnea TaxID=189513 RepID=UPI001D098E46|nr:cytochrome P450 4C1-like [Chrysoperla carnea]